MTGNPSHPRRLTGDEMTCLLELARAGVEGSVSRSGQRPEVPGDPPEWLTERRGCFVTLLRDGVLRGCIGNVMPRDSLHRMIVDNARGAALHDPRFSPVTVEELPRLIIEVSVLTEPTPLPHAGPEDLLRRLVPQRDGVFLHVGSRAATFLPQVWAKLPDPRQFLDRLAEKAGCPSGAWRMPGAEVLIYQAQCLAETAPPGPESC